MNCAVTADLNRYLAQQENHEAAWESVYDEREQIEAIDAKIDAYMAMDSDDFSDAMAADMAALEDERANLRDKVEAVMGYAIDWANL